MFSYLRHRKGHGIHSPFVYNLITRVIEEKSPYYAFEEIEDFRKSLLERKDELSEITARETPSAKFGAFLFRLVKELKCKSVAVVGASTGVMGLYVAMVSRIKTDCYLLEERETLLQPVKDFALEQNLFNLYFTDANLEKADLIFINQLKKELEIDEIIKKCQSLSGNNTVWVLNHIDKDKKMCDLWQSVQTPSLKLDLQSVGLIFWNEKFREKTYKLYWKDGKK
jgi:hypothetical protein